MSSWLATVSRPLSSAWEGVAFVRTSKYHGWHQKHVNLANDSRLDRRVNGMLLLAYHGYRVILFRGCHGRGGDVGFICGGHSETQLAWPVVRQEAKPLIRQRRNKDGFVLL